MMKKIALVVSCEHAVDSIPTPYQSLFVPFKDLLASHRGIDFGALTIAEHLAKQVSCDFIQATTTRLLVDCNKSMSHPRCFSEVTRSLPPEEKQKILNLYYWPYRQQVMASIKKHIEQGSQVWHLSIHSFTPVLHDIVRNADIGFLYDPQRPPEKTLARQWKKEIQKHPPEYKIRMNYPYKGVSDGFTSMMRKIYPSEAYVGIEVESNQALTQNTQNLDNLKNILAISLLKLIC
ncbi:N-formylglutamate amidohydrolase [Legionella maioricensis]|uniref:N-formylglutamate amidohydrolase n=1 Tax=Legionella maioricensis TaxID=2896528 RepID=A0A9X2CYI3_9GAMM|nr:N-formylglutamate amidohydrolase [Legionella maioricensis]MCL9683244.1 N-formylglutamate amidohydrolase [Legionella maioricensis]MCL9686058.1 N-formylglutamate amidohydrolase [Legionella maioricensis]